MLSNKDGLRQSSDEEQDVFVGLMLDSSNFSAVDDNIELKPESKETGVKVLLIEDWCLSLVASTVPAVENGFIGVEVLMLLGSIILASIIPGLSRTALNMLDSDR